MDDHNTSPVRDDNTGMLENPENPQPELRDELAELKKQFEDLNDRYLRLAADFENYRKRTTRDNEAMAQHANEKFAVDILEIVDNLDRALKADNNHLRVGMEQIRCLMGGILSRHGITPIDALKKSFDPSEHEAVAHIASGDAEGTVVDVVSPGYRMHNKVIRYAKVAVSNGNISNIEMDA
jgi:molecular chaperone GrpE